MSWLADERTEVAAERILDAAEELFASQGVSGTGMDAVAKAAGCSRATLYRYFDNRQALHFAIAHREARRIVDEVRTQLVGVRAREERAVVALCGAIRAVRSSPHLAAWVTPGESELLAEVLRESPLIEAFTAKSVGADDVEAARWVLRVIVSFLQTPGADEAEEAELVRRFVAPVVRIR